ncbi:MAG: TRAP transporter substrate-binding protein, partial [candidate division Zixibacteria bacterium]|nr:TRAP transporter substrate-binding protein [candidate division Zixibacteria bacterium]
LKGLGYTSYGFHTLATNKPFKSLDDLDKFKFRSAETGLSMDILKLLGISPTPLPFAEVYQALRTGLMDGIDNSPGVIDLVKWGEVLKYVADTNHWFGWYVFLIKKSWLEGLPADLQKIIVEVGSEVCQQTMRMAQEQDIAALAKFEKMGITLVKLSNDERAKFRSRLHPLHEKYGKVIDEDFLQKTYKLLDYKK